MLSNHFLRKAYGASILFFLTKLQTEYIPHCGYAEKICIYICFQFAVVLDLPRDQFGRSCHVVPRVSSVFRAIISAGRKGLPHGEGRDKRGIQINPHGPTSVNNQN